MKTFTNPNTSQLLRAVGCMSLAIACTCGLALLPSQTHAQSTTKAQPGSFDELLRSFESDDTIILEGPALNVPTEVQSRSIKQVPNQVVMGDEGVTVPGPFDDIPSVIVEQPGVQYPVDNPFLDDPNNHVPTIGPPLLEGPTIEQPIPNLSPNYGWKNQNETQYEPSQTIPPPTILPELTAPRPLPRSSQADIAPALPSPPSQFVPRTSPQYQPGLIPRSTAPRLSPYMSNVRPDCPNERARHELMMRAQLESLSRSAYIPRTGYIPYGGLGVDREFDYRRAEALRSRYRELERLERLQLELMRQRYQRPPTRYVPYGGNRPGGLSIGFLF